MKTLRIILWAGVVVLAGVLGWLTLAVTDTKDKIAEAPFGVPFTLVDQNGQAITEQAFRGKPTALILNTIKGKKVQECQYNPNWHTSAPRNVEAAGLWLSELWDQDGRRLGIPPEFPTALTQAIEIVPPVHGNPDDIQDRQA